MTKIILLAAALVLSLPSIAADTTPAADSAPAATAAPSAPSAMAGEDKSQRVRLKKLQATCNRRATAHKLDGETRKAFISKCLGGK